MKICAIICEFNPFHNGHAYLLNQAKNLSGCDAVFCIMSGSFTQRGEPCVLDKFTRAKHAVLGGADCVLELPTPFAVAPAEIFAKGAIKILSSIPEVTTLAFGCEEADQKKFLKSADVLINESQEFSSALKERLTQGESYIRSYSYAFKKCGGDENFISLPNNVLGVEYTKAIYTQKANINILPIKRIGSSYSDENLKESYSSANAIRKNLKSGQLKHNVPEYVLKDLIKTNYPQNEFETLCLFSLLQAKKENLKDVYGCNEGLENKLKNSVGLSYEKLIESVTAKRYASSRIKRILCAELLGLYKTDTEKFLKSPLYLKPLAVNGKSANEVYSALAKSEYPTVILQKSLNDLCATAKKCFKISQHADEIYDFINNSQTYNFTVLNV